MTVALVLFLIILTANTNVIKISESSILVNSLHRCLLATGENFFTPREVIVIFPNKSPHFDEMLQEFTKRLKWPLALINRREEYHPNIFDPKLLVPLKNVIVFWKDTLKDKDLKEFFWRHPPIAKIIVICRNASFVNGIIKQLWKGRVATAIVLVSNILNNVSFDIYKWYPFHNTSCGRNVGTVKRIDQCFLGKFAENTTLSRITRPLKHSTTCVLVAGYLKIPPYVMNLKNNSIGREDYIDTKHGIEVNLVNLMAKKLNIRVRYIKSELLGKVDSNGKVTGSLKQLKNSKIDMALGYAITLSGSYFFHTTRPYKTDFLAWCVPHTLVSRLGNYYLSYLAIIAIGTTSFILSILIWYFNKLMKSERRESMRPGEVFLSTLAVLAAVSINHRSKSSAVRLIFMTVVILGFYTDIIFISNMTSALSNSFYEEKFGSYEAINKYNLTKYHVPHIEMYLQDPEFTDIGEKWIKCNDREKCLSHVASGKKSAYFISQANAEVMAKDFVSPNNDPLVYCFGMQVPLQKTLMMGRGFHLFRRIDTLIGRILSSGLIFKWEDDVRNHRKRKEGEKLKVDGNKPLTSEHFSRVFKYLLVAHCFSVSVFLLELLLPRRRIPYIN